MGVTCRPCCSKACLTGGSRYTPPSFRSQSVHPARRKPGPSREGVKCHGCLTNHHSQSTLDLLLGDGFEACTGWLSQLVSKLSAPIRDKGHAPPTIKSVCDIMFNPGGNIHVLVELTTRDPNGLGRGSLFTESYWSTSLASSGLAVAPQ